MDGVLPSKPADVLPVVTHAKKRLDESAVRDESIKKRLKTDLVKIDSVYVRRGFGDHCFAREGDLPEGNGDQTKPLNVKVYREQKAKKLQAERTDIQACAESGTASTPYEIKDEDLQLASKSLIDAIKMRQKYMAMSMQTFQKTANCFLEQLAESGAFSDAFRNSIFQDSTEKKKNASPTSPQAASIDPFCMDIPEGSDFRFQMKAGVMRVYSESPCKFEARRCTNWPYPDLATFVSDHTMLMTLISDGPLKSFCQQRLENLLSRYQDYFHDNEHLESAAQKLIRKDFYTVNKIDTHVHAAACMNQKQLLGFIKKKMKTKANDIVDTYPDGKGMTLSEVCTSLKINPDDLSVDILNVHADRHTFGQFKEFNQKFSPFGHSQLRDIFLKTDNHFGGTYFAEILKEIFADLEKTKYVKSEYRLSVYGRSPDDWEKLAKWFVKNRVYSSSVRWLVQIPRLYHEHKRDGFVSNFQQLLANVFEPLFEVSVNPESHPELHLLLLQISGFDSVDDESREQEPIINKDTPTPDNWSSMENPSYTYYCYYLFANLAVLNHLRSERKFNTFVFRPHCGEAGPVQHLVTAFLTAESISHGVVLRESPVLQYLYYLTQIGVAMSPLSNHYLFLKYKDNPLVKFFALGLLVSLSTDDPLQFHFTKEPLIEEYAVAAHMLKLSTVDMCELARNSVLMSGFPFETKQRWLGRNFTRDGPAGNDVNYSNVPDIRVAYRYKTLLEELFTVFQSASYQASIE